MTPRVTGRRPVVAALRSCVLYGTMLAAHAWSARLLTRHGPACQSQALSVWSCANGRLDLVCDWLGSQRFQNLLRTAWPRLVGALRQGRAPSVAPGVGALPLRTRREGLLGALVVVGTLPATGATRALLDDLVRRLAAALRPPLPSPSPDVLWLPMGQLDAPGGATEVERRFYTALLQRHGGNLALAGEALQVPRQTLRKRVTRLSIRVPGLRLVRAVPDAIDLEDEALELERSTCRLVVQRCNGDVRLAAAAIRLTPTAWRAYLRSLRIDVPESSPRSTRSRRA